MRITVEKKTINGHPEVWSLFVKNLVKVNDFQSAFGPTPALNLYLEKDSSFIVKFMDIDRRNLIYDSIHDGSTITYEDMWSPRAMKRIKGYKPTFILKAMALAANINKQHPRYLPVFEGIDLSKIERGLYLNPTNKLEVAARFARMLVLPKKPVNPIDFYFSIL